MPTVKIDLSNLPLVTNEVYYPLYNNQDRYLVLMGGGSSGKSVFTAQKMIYRCLTESGHRFLALRKVKNTIRDSVFTELKKAIHSWGMQELFVIPAGVSGELYIRCVNGNEILFAGLDDVEKLKSIVGITSMWIEEASELTPEDFRQLDIRMRGQTANYKQIMLTFNPISISHWLKDEFFSGEPKPETTTLKTTYRDNRFLDAAAIRVLEGFRQTDPYYYTVYCLGEWGVLGQSVFNAEIVTNRLIELRDTYRAAPPTRYSLTSDLSAAGEPVKNTSRMTPDSAGCLTVYADPQPRHPYVIGADTAEGGIDFSVAHVIDNVTGQQVAVWRGHTDVDLFAYELYKLGSVYNSALIAPEVNFDSHVIRTLERLQYPRLYMRTDTDQIGGHIQRKFGFKTTSLTRPQVIGNLVQIVRDGIDCINDLDTLDEMLTFVRNDSGRPEAQPGKHDDCVMALAIAYSPFVREQQSMAAEIEPENKPVKLFDKLGIAKQEASWKTW